LRIQIPKYLFMAKIFSMSEAASIAIHSMVLIARNKDGINAVKIAEQTGSSKNHISKVAQRLVKDDLLKSVRGPSGGFTLKKSPNDITLLDIYESIEGPLEITDCPMATEVCHFDQCIMGNVVNKMTLEFKKFLKGQTLKAYI
jgi:Rrf2 family protein